MKDLSHRRARPGGSGGGPQLTLGAFGKHPGEDDHVQGIGVSTEGLAQAKQALYVAGIGGQIDSGAWEKLEAEKRLPGFDHTFLWLQPGHALLGRFWSSTDRKGRAKYPMVVCVDSEGVSANFLLEQALPVLERLRRACQETNSIEQVNRDCRATQDHLRALVARQGPESGGPPVEARKRFLDHPQLGPSRMGLLRTLHELKASPAVSSGGRTARSSHLRVPLACGSRNEALLLWGALLRRVVPEAVPLLLLSRNQTEWLDVILSAPVSDDFLCLQASLKALPLTTEIPYQLASDAWERWLAVEAGFLGTPAPAPVSHQAPTPAPAEAVAGAQAARGGTAPARKPGGKLAWLVGGVGLVALATLGLVWFVGQQPGNVASSTSGDAASGQTGAVAAAPVTPAAPNRKAEQQYQAALMAAQTAQQAGDYSNAMLQAQAALKAKPGDPAAGKLIEELQAAAAAAGSRDQAYRAATNAAALAFLQMDYPKATNEAGIALGIRPGDPVASTILSNALQALGAESLERSYQAALEAARTAFSAADYREGTNQAMRALQIKPGDAAAAKLLSDAREAWEKAQAFQRATNAVAQALGEGNYAQAAKEAALALSLRPNQPELVALKARAEEGLAFEAAKAHLERGAYAEAAAACKLHPGIEPFSSLAASVAAEQAALDEAGRKLARGDYSLIAGLTNQSYSHKAPFSNLLSKAVQEKTALDALQRLRSADARQEVKARLAEPAMAAVLDKPPFAELRTWADATPAPQPAPPPAPQPASQPEPQAQTLTRLDGELEVLLVQFDVFKPTDQQIQTDKARQTKPLPYGALSNPQAFLDQVDRLREGYRKGGWLEQNNRKKNLDRLVAAINNR